jgi:hypothetical protein
MDNRVQWINESGGFEIGKIFRGPLEQYYTAQNGSIYREPGEFEPVMILPYHGGTPVFVEYGKLSPRPIHEVLQAAK